METIKFNEKEYNVLHVYKNKKLLVSKDDKKFIIIPFANQEGLNQYLKNKKELKRFRIECSKVLKVDKKGLLILEKYIDGEDLLKIAATNRIDTLCYKELFRIYRNCRFAGIALNYKPENFVHYKKYFYYVNDEIYKIRERQTFEKSDDIQLWMNTNAQKRYVESRGYKYLDRPLIKDGGELNKRIVLLCTANW